MSGHSKWATIKRDKNLNDAKKGAIFTKFSKDISVAAKAGGGDPSMNAVLSAAMAKAKAANMPNDKIQRAINKGLGISNSGIALTDITYEAYGPGEVGFIIDASTDNKNRTNGEVRTIIERNGGRLVEGGAIAWLFESKGWILIPFETEDEKQKRLSSKWGDKDEKPKLQRENWEELELALMDQEGVLDIQADTEEVNIYTSPDSAGKIRKFIEDESNIYVEDSEIIKEAKTLMEVNDEIKDKVLNLKEKLEEHDDVQSVWIALS